MSMERKTTLGKVKTGLQNGVRKADRQPREGVREAEQMTGANTHQGAIKTKQNLRLRTGLACFEQHKRGESLSARSAGRMRWLDWGQRLGRMVTLRCRRRSGTERRAQGR